MNALCKKLLKMIYDNSQDSGGSLQIDASGRDLGYKSAHALKIDIDYLLDAGYVKNDITMTRFYSLFITAKGESFVENDFKSPDVSTNNIFNIQNATNSIIGTQSNVTMHIGDVIQQARKDIDSSDSNDKEELHKIINLLEDIAENKPDIKKGLLSNFASVIQRNSWIASPITSIVLKLLIGI